jgi:hypothetical protein
MQKHNEGGLPSKETLTRNTSAEAGSLGAPSRGAHARGEPAVQISAKGRNEPVVRNQPEVISRTLLSEVSSTDIPLQGASSSSIPAEGEGLKHLA